MKLHTYEVRVEWTGNDGEGTKTYKGYRRDHAITSEGKPQIQGSSDPSFRGDRSRYNPEELLVASLSSCHMLWYLHLCTVSHIVNACPEETVYTYLFELGWENAAPRVLRNSTGAEWELAGQPARGSRPKEAEHIGHTKSGKEILSYEDTPPLRDMEGDWERCALYAGESVGVIHKIQSARDVVREVARDAAKVVRQLTEVFVEVEGVD